MLNKDKPAVNRPSSEHKCDIMCSDGSITCPTCGNKLNDLSSLRCPRCFNLLVNFGCDGNCGGCAKKG